MARRKRKKGRCCTSRTLSLPINNRPKKPCQWNDDAMTRTLQAVASGTMAINRAALEFNVPCTTLKDRVVGRITHGCNMGPKTYLMRDEEKELADFLINCAKMGFAKNKERRYEFSA